ncbi:MAG: 5'/3'-nucleotidase SurE [Acidobacteria bacterium]|nr:5'/3'-nucleotidase SurE [Acidobacteriota bacterium]
MPRILVTNDDGISAPGIQALEAALRAVGEVYTVAPLYEQSASSRRITLRKPFRYETAGKNRYAVDGSPADCAMMALTLLLGFKPDLVVSGINNGPNLGENVYYSGTVAGAAEGAKYGIPAIAMSVNQRVDIDYGPAADFAARLARQALADGLEPGIVLNVNVPHPTYTGVEITHQSKKISRNLMIETRDPYDRSYYWMHEEVPLETAEAGSDYAAVRDGKVSITPLHFDHTAWDHLESLRSLENHSWGDALEPVPAP